MSKQIGTDEKPFTFRKSIYGKSDGGKGARPRPGVYTQQYKDNFDKNAFSIFDDIKNKDYLNIVHKSGIKYPGIC